MPNTRMYCGDRMTKEQLSQAVLYALCRIPPDFVSAKELIDAYQNACEADEFDMLLLKLVREYPLNSRECEECDKDIECVKACPKYTLKHLPEIVRFFLNEGWNHRKYGIELLSMLLYTTDGKVILEIAKMILEIGVDGTDEDFDRLLGYIAEAESHARCSWVDCETNADDLAEYYDLVLRVNRGDIFG